MGKGFQYPNETKFNYPLKLGLNFIMIQECLQLPKILLLLSRVFTFI